MGGKSGKFPLRVSVLLIVLVIAVTCSGESQGSIIRSHQAQGQDEGLDRSITNSLRGNYLKFIKNSGNKLILKASPGDLRAEKTTSTTEATTTTTAESTTTTAEAETTTTTEEPTTTTTTATTKTTPSTTSSTTTATTKTTSTAPTTTTTTTTPTTTTTATPKSTTTTTSTRPPSTSTSTSTPSPCPAPKTPSDHWSWKAFFVGMLVTGSLMASAYFAWKLYSSGIRFPSYQRV